MSLEDLLKRRFVKKSKEKFVLGLIHPTFEHLKSNLKYEHPQQSQTF